MLAVLCVYLSALTLTLYILLIYLPDEPNPPSYSDEL
jgi:hypothetical protein